MFIKSNERILINVDYIEMVYVKQNEEQWHIVIKLFRPEVGDYLKTILYKSFNSEYDAREALNDLYMILP